MQRKIGALRLGLTFAGCFLGAGYVSGQELWQYFGAFGAHGLLGLVLAIALLGGTGVVLLRLSARTGHRDDGRADRARGHSVAAHTCRRADGGAAVRRRVHHGGPASARSQPDARSAGVARVGRSCACSSRRRHISVSAAW